MDRAALIGALRGTDPASQGCVVALTEGADFHVGDDAPPVPDLVRIYSRRAKHAAAIGLEHGGFDRALADLNACPTGAVRLGQVTDRAGQRHYQLFLSPNADDVVACLWVHHEP
jgi:hypothetical protein